MYVSLRLFILVNYRRVPIRLAIKNQTKSPNYIYLPSDTRLLHTMVCLPWLCLVKPTYTFEHCETLRWHTLYFYLGQPYIRLRGSDIPLKGRVEVFHRGIWGTVCTYNSEFESFTASARVACWELGFHDAVQHGRWDKPRASGKIWLKDVKCRGDEKSLVFCPHNNWENTGCGHYWDRYVQCKWLEE